KRSRISPAIIPDEHNPSAGSQDAPKLGAAALAIEPMKGLPGSDKIHARFRQRRGFSTGGHAGELSIRTKRLLAGFAHLPIRFDTENLIAIREKQFREKTGARTHVGAEGQGTHTALSLQDRAD